MTEDANAVLAKFVEQRQIKLDAEREKNTPTDDRSGDIGVNPPAVRATDGGAPGTKEQNPLKMAAEIDAELGTDDEDGEITMDSTVTQIKAELDARGIDYNGVTKKADLFALLG